MSELSSKSTETTAPPESPELREWHLTDSTIRTAITAHLRSLGYEPEAGTLRIYGYSPSGPELSVFQGHIAMKPGTTPASPGGYRCHFGEEDRQMILLALHKLRQERPGFDYALGEIEKQIGGQIDWP